MTASQRPNGSVDAPDCLCPVCGHHVNAATSARFDGAKPSPGDLTMCIACATLLAFTDRMTLRESTAEEVAALDDESRAIVERARAFIATRKARGEWIPAEKPESAS